MKFICILAFCILSRNPNFNIFQLMRPVMIFFRQFFLFIYNIQILLLILTNQTDRGCQLIHRTQCPKKTISFQETTVNKKCNEFLWCVRKNQLSVTIRVSMVRSQQSWEIAKTQMIIKINKSQPLTFNELGFLLLNYFYFFFGQGQFMLFFSL